MSLRELRSWGGHHIALPSCGTADIDFRHLSHCPQTHICPQPPGGGVAAAPMGVMHAPISLAGTAAAMPPMPGVMPAAPPVISSRIVVLQVRAYGCASVLRTPGVFNVGGGEWAAQVHAHRSPRSVRCSTLCYCSICGFVASSALNLLCRKLGSLPRLCCC